VAQVKLLKELEVELLASLEHRRQLAEASLDADERAVIEAERKKMLGECAVVFAEFDEDSNGTINWMELRTALISCGIVPSPAELKYILQRCVSDDPRDMPACLRACMCRSLPVWVSCVRAERDRALSSTGRSPALCIVFGRYDVDGDGVISFEEFTHIASLVQLARTRELEKGLAEAAD
jgi:Ca2+-binding EF-hand superfamily protein